jgi:hypothetical protein
LILIERHDEFMYGTFVQREDVKKCMALSHYQKARTVPLQHPCPKRACALVTLIEDSSMIEDYFAFSRRQDVFDINVTTQKE